MRDKGQLSVASCQFLVGDGLPVDEAGSESGHSLPTKNRELTTDNCLCPWPTAVGCHALRVNLARWWGESEPAGEVCECACHEEEKEKR